MAELDGIGMYGSTNLTLLGCPPVTVAAITFEFNHLRCSCSIHLQLCDKKNLFDGKEK